jgi:NitT/TauT family transport system ATP-binding protein
VIVNAQRPKSRAGELVATRISKSYGVLQSKKDVIKDCSFTVERGKLTVVIGPSGCGKSTLIGLLAGFQKPRGGTITLHGRPVSAPARDRLVLFQESALFPCRYARCSIQ